jgi:hypothetical protein
MSWITLTEAGVQTKLSGAELVALKTAALAVGQTNPLPEVLTLVTREVRGYVAANSKNVLGAEGTIPDELESAALNRIRYELATRLPVASLLTQARTDANTAATALFKEVAADRFRIVPPVTEATEQAATGTAVQVVTSSTRLTNRDRMSGL